MIAHFPGGCAGFQGMPTNPADGICWAAGGSGPSSPHTFSVLFSLITPSMQHVPPYGSSGAGGWGSTGNVGAPGWNSNEGFTGGLQGGRADQPAGTLLRSGGGGGGGGAGPGGNGAAGGIGGSANTTGQGLNGVAGSSATANTGAGGGGGGGGGQGTTGGATGGAGGVGGSGKVTIYWFEYGVSA